VVGKVRFPLMGEEYLRNRVVGIGEDGEWMAGVVAEALRAKAARREGAVFELEALGRKALEDRVGLGVRWEEYREGGELRLVGQARRVSAFVACAGRMCSGSFDGSIRVWSGASGEHERTLQANDANEDSDFVYALAAWEGRLISCHESGRLRVWNVATGECDKVLEGRDPAFPDPADIAAIELMNFVALAACGSRLASGSADGSIQVWGTGTDGRLMSERRLLGHTGALWSLAGWQDKVASGSSDGSIRVWDVGTGAHVATLAGHSRGVTALVVHGDRLLSASQDGTIRAWDVGTWAGLLTVEAYEQGTGSSWHFPECLAVSGSKLVSGSTGAGHELQREVRVWGLEELELQQTLPQPASSDVHALVAVDGKVWGVVGKDVVVWGLRA
jgi:WD40 repeat protein